MNKWITIWIRGEFKSSKNIWKEWIDAIVPFGESLPGGITHFGASSPSFKSGKYLQYKRGKKKLFQAICNDEDFHSMEFITAPNEYITMVQDQRFGLTLRKYRNNEIIGNFQLEYFEKYHLKDFESLARKFFVSGRLEVYEVGNDLPVNYILNFGKKEGYLPKGFKSINVEDIS
jgi:hypothetical protein